MFGSVFLGDPRQRLIASSTSPPTSPTPGAPHISPEVALQLRIRWLEALLLGVNDLDATKAKETTVNKTVDGESEEDEEDEQEDVDEQTLIRQAEEIQRKLDSIVIENDDLARFVERYDMNAHLFTPAFAFSHQNPSTAPSYSALSSADLDALLQEMEPDIREADRSLASISQLEKQGVTGAGKLEEYESLLPRLAEVLKKHKEDMVRFEALETRMMGVLESYGQRVELMSELFVEWNEIVGEAEVAITKLEKEEAGRVGMGLQ